ncbi:carbohydrate kinase family protein [Amycolatopsis sp. CA-230715]|uniref:carbohydrate kinase family protein n=1 Tax=Amycolatopsis sp. CA-230715 TaxID=2745196 RepID=UPI001C022D54|nr:carbohydrate kinase family protein [Amycolatopsis sp. CA-230715]QWF83523.1 ATP-dependent 6-phosphofructokinase [Amycolatopsis sp. CA-230715]
MKISVIGNLGLDVVAAQVDRMPPPGTEVMIDTIDVRPGGSAGNTAMALAALGVRHELHASLGDDTTATLVRALLTEGGVDCSHLRTTPGTPTAVSIAVQSNRRDRGFLATDGHLRSYDRDSVPREALTADLVLFTGYFTTPALQGPPTEQMLRQVKASGGRTLFDPGSDPDGWRPHTLTTLKSLLPLVDVFLPNARELAVVAGIEDPRAATKALHELTGGHVIAKLGADGCLGIGPGEDFTCSARSARTADTTGAGDAFNAGLLYGLAHRLPWPRAARDATIVATEAVSRTSPHRHIREPDLIDLRNHRS